MDRNRAVNGNRRQRSVDSGFGYWIILGNQIASVSFAVLRLANVIPAAFHRPERRNDAKGWAGHLTNQQASQSGASSALLALGFKVLKHLKEELEKRDGQQERLVVDVRRKRAD